MRPFHIRKVHSRSRSAPAIHNPPQRMDDWRRDRGNEWRGQPTPCRYRSRLRSEREYACLSTAKSCATHPESWPRRRQFRVARFLYPCVRAETDFPPPGVSFPPYAEETDVTPPVGKRVY